MVEQDAKGKEMRESHRALTEVVVRDEETKSDLAGLYTSQEDGLVYLFCSLYRVFEPSATNDSRSLIGILSEDRF